MFDQLRTVGIGDHKTGLFRGGTTGMHRTLHGPVQDRPVNLAHLLDGAVLFHADHNPVGMEKVLHRRAFA